MDYSLIENPLSDEALKYIIRSYKDKSSMYDIVTKRCNDKKVHKGECIQKARDSIYARVYKLWRESILNPNETRIRLINSNDLKTLQEILRNKESVNSEREYNSFINSNPLLEKYAWSKHGDNTAWTHINSNYINTGQNLDWNTEHKLYINTDGVEDCVVDMFISSCMERKIPYYIKYSPNISRDDMIVIYSDTEHLDEYIDILKNIFNDNPWLDEYMQEPPILTGKIDNHIGYASEPSNKKESYNQKRSKIIKSSIDECLIIWYLTHYEFFDNICKEVINEVVGNSITNEEENDLINQMKIALMNFDILKEFPRQINVTLGNKTISIDSYILKNHMKKYIIYILENDDMFIDSIRKGIQSKCKENGIDDTFCFDVDRKELLNKTNYRK